MLNHFNCLRSVHWRTVRVTVITEKFLELLCYCEFVSFDLTRKRVFVNKQNERNEFSGAGTGKLNNRPALIPLSGVTFLLLGKDYNRILSSISLSYVSCLSLVFHPAFLRVRHIIPPYYHPETSLDLLLASTGFPFQFNPLINIPPKQVFFLQLLSTFLFNLSLTATATYR